MFDTRDDMRRAGIVALAVGTTLGAAAAALLGVRAWRRRRDSGMEIAPELLELETAVVDALVADDVAGRLPIEVEAIADGIVELTGRVDSEMDADRAVAAAQRADGVRTVLNRMEVGPIAEHLADTRRRFAAGAPELRESRWYGVGVGTGRRRQSRATDPDRSDDSIHMRTEQFEAERHGEASEAPHIEPGADRIDPQPPM